jgi:Ca2+-binding EF-hand superfamily protein
MKKMLVAVLAVSGAAIVYAQAETHVAQGDGQGMRAQMRALIQGDGMDVADLANLLNDRAEARFAALDADGNGTVSLEEFLADGNERAEAMFERMGPDENGVVTRTGRGPGAGMHRGGPRGEGGLSEEERAQRRSERAADEFARLDADGDGMISPEEFEAGMEARAERFAERRGERGGPRHSMMRDMRGEMPEEMRQMRGQLRDLMREGMNFEAFAGLMEERTTARFERLDADGDGELTRDEFTANVAERADRMFARMDRNDDGMVTREDRPRWGGGRHGGRDRGGQAPNSAE